MTIDLWKIKIENSIEFNTDLAVEASEIQNNTVTEYSPILSN